MVFTEGNIKLGSSVMTKDVKKTLYKSFLSALYKSYNYIVWQYWKREKNIFLNYLYCDL